MRNDPNVTDVSVDNAHPCVRVRLMGDQCGLDISVNLTREAADKLCRDLDDMLYPEEAT